MPEKEGTTIRILTSMRPEAAPDESGSKRRIKSKKDGRVKIRTRLRSMQAKREKARTDRPSKADRLLRNTAVACALILTVVALKNIDTPLTRKVTEAFQSIVSMEALPDGGGLSFVRSMMPESALVFLNIDPVGTLPLAGEVLHAWSEEQPWTEYETEQNAGVRAVCAGTVLATAQDQEGDWTVLVKNEDGTQAVYSFLSALTVEIGQSVMRADTLGHTGNNARLYLEYRVNGESVDPAAFLSPS